MSILLLGDSDMTRSWMMWPWLARMVSRWKHTRWSWLPPVLSLKIYSRETSIHIHWSISEGSNQWTWGPSLTSSTLRRQNRHLRPLGTQAARYFCAKSSYLTDWQYTHASSSLPFMNAESIVNCTFQNCIISKCIFPSGFGFVSLFFAFPRESFPVVLQKKSRMIWEFSWAGLSLNVNAH